MGLAKEQRHLKKINMDLIVGGSILLSLFVLVASVLWLKEAKFTNQLVEYAILFPDVSTLQIGDPVRANGVKVGSVHRLKLRNDRVAVIIKVDRSLKLTDSCLVSVQNIGLMGERMVGVRLSQKGSPYQPIAKNDKDTTFIRGYFDTGIAEALGLMGNVLTRAEGLVRNLEMVIDSTVGDPRFSGNFQSIVSRLDTVVRATNDLIAQNKSRINRTVTDVSVIASDVRTLVDANDERITTLVDNGARIAEKAVLLVDEVDSIAVSIKTLLGDVEKKEGTLRMLIEDEQLYRDLKKSLSTLDTLINDVKDDGLKLKVRLGFRKKKN